MNDQIETTAKLPVIPVLSLKGVRRHYVQGKSIIDVLRGIDLQVAAGEMVALVVRRRKIDSAACHRIVGSSR